MQSGDKGTLVVVVLVKQLVRYLHAAAVLKTYSHFLPDSCRFMSL